MEFVLSLAEALRRLEKQPTPDHLDLGGASLFLIPLEYETLGRILCPQCGTHEWDTLIHASLPRRADMDWPYVGPGGDRHQRQCKKCEHNITVTFWFTK